jgi:hypothetical protein
MIINIERYKIHVATLHTAPKVTQLNRKAGTQREEIAPGNTFRNSTTSDETCSEAFHSLRDDRLSKANGQQFSGILS